MTIDFSFGKAPAYRVATIAWKGNWSEAKVRGSFAKIEKWAKSNRVRTGKWFFREPNMHSFEAAIEVRGKVRGGDGIRVRTYPASRVATITFDPDVVSPAVIYHGITDWLRWRRKEKKIRSAGDYREVYTDDPWKNPRAWSQTTVQVLVRP
jgi:effector-binding domain-containing protein